MAVILTLTVLLVAERVSSASVLHKNQFRNTGDDEFVLETFNYHQSGNEQERTETAALLPSEQAKNSNRYDVQDEFKDYGSDNSSDEKLKKEIEDLVYEYKKASEEKTTKGKELKNQLKVLESLKDQPAHVQEAALEYFRSYLAKRNKFEGWLNNQIRELERRIDASISPLERKQLLRELEKHKKLLDEGIKTLELFFEFHMPGDELCYRK